MLRVARQSRGKWGVKCACAFDIHKGAPHGLDDQKLDVAIIALNSESKMAGNFLKLVVFITLSLHYVAAQGTSE